MGLGTPPCLGTLAPGLVERARPHMGMWGTKTGLTPSHICTKTGLTPATSAPRLGSPLSHLHQDWARPCHICTKTGPSQPCHICIKTGLTPVASAPRLASTLCICPARLSQDATTTNAIISLFDGDEAFAALAKVMPSRAAVDREWASGARACTQVLWGMPGIPLERD